VISPVIGGSITQPNPWEIVRRQHGVIAREQLLACGITRHGIAHRVAKGRLHRLWPDVYAVGRPELAREGIWMAAVLTCGEGAVLSHESAAALWGIRDQRRGPIHVSVPSPRDPRRRGLRVHRREEVETTLANGIPVTTPVQTIIDLAPTTTGLQLERLIDEADKLDLVHPEALHTAAAEKGGVGGSRVRELLGGRAFVLTDSELERRFVPLAAKAGLSRPETRVSVNGHKVDFFFRAEGIVVETDGGRYHRTPSQQRRDRIRDHAHALAGLTPLRFTHEQVRYEPEYVAEVLRRLSSNP
jgi:very-short-patch-repair endonuclease